MDHEDRTRRYATVRVFPLDEEPVEDLTDATTLGERIAMVEALSREAWALSGLAVATVDRAEMPIAFLELGSASDSAAER